MLPHTSGPTPTSEVIVDLIEKHRDDDAQRLIAIAPVAVQAEAIREYLWRRDKAAVSIAERLLTSIQLPHVDLRTVFTAAAEAGQVTIVRHILRAHGDAIQPMTLRLAFEAALYEKRRKMITFLGDTHLLPTETKYRAIQPSIYESSAHSDSSGTPRSEMGTVEVAIIAAYRNEQADRWENRIKGAQGGPRRDGQKRKCRIERRYEGSIAGVTARIRDYLPPLPPGSSLYDREHRGEVRDLLVAQYVRELTRQKELALIQREQRSTRNGFDRYQKSIVWRSTNPAEHKDSKSFAEILEDVFSSNRGAPPQRQLNFADLLDTVLATWGGGRTPLSREGLSQLIKTNHPEGKTLSNSVMYSWKNDPEHSPISPSVKILVDAFKLDLIHELMMWRIANGRQGEDVESLVSDAEVHFRTPQERQARAQLFNALLEGAGIPIVRLQQLLKVWQPPLWKRGQSISDGEVCAHFVRLVNPPGAYPEQEREAVCNINRRLEAFLGARPATILDAVLAAEKAGGGNPTGLLLEMLTARRGIRPLTYAEGGRLLGVSASKFRHMRSTTDSRGAAITEDQAIMIADWLQNVTPETRHLLDVTQRAERRLVVDSLTGIPSPAALLVKLCQGDLQHAGEIVRLTRLRRGVNQEQGMSSFECGKSHVSVSHAQSIADWLGFVGREHVQSRRIFICFATGVDQSRTPDEIFDQVIAGTLPRHLALRQLFDLTGKTRWQISQGPAFSRSCGRIMGTEQRDGRITSSYRAIAVAREVGLLHRCDEFIQVFSARSGLRKKEGDSRSS